MYCCVFIRMKALLRILFAFVVSFLIVSLLAAGTAAGGSYNNFRLIYVRFIHKFCFVTFARSVHIFGTTLQSLFLLTAAATKVFTFETDQSLARTSEVRQQRPA